jgi:hypothetical protein
VAQDKPSEVILKKTFAAFGDIRMVDIPMLDPYRHKVSRCWHGKIDCWYLVLKLG